jgi:hypothetical protein
VTWNHRLIRHPDGYLALHEVYYDEAGEPNKYTADPAVFVVDEEEGANALFEAMKRALDSALHTPVLDVASFTPDQGQKFTPAACLEAETVPGFTGTNLSQAGEKGKH